MMKIHDLHSDDEQAITQVAALLVEGFREHWPDAWPDMKSALEEVRESFGRGRISRVAVSEDGAVLGWIGGIEDYDGNVWELHPLVVSEARRKQGVGRALVADLENLVRARGAYTLRLGTDDEDNQTSLSK